ncbi:MAG: hypothetical protein V4614_10315 [Pseudomonadota bacterium]
MTAKTNFSFEVFYPERSAITIEQRNETMRKLGPTLQALLAVGDSNAAVVISDSHKGSGNKIVEITTTLDDAALGEVLQKFSSTNDLTVTALE